MSDRQRKTGDPRLRLSSLQRCEVVTESGDRVGHVFDVATDLVDPSAPPAVRALLLGRAGLARRLGIGRGRAGAVSIDDVVALRQGQVLVRRRSDWPER
jgi:hypothetical protein